MTIENEEEPKSRADVLLHPIRLRIALALQERSLTTAKLHSLLGDVPLPSLYRHMERLVRAGIIAVQETQTVHANQERVYRLVESAANLTPDEVERLTPADHRRYFTVFVTGLLSLFDRYIRSGGRPGKNSVMYYAESVYLTDDQYREYCDRARASIREMTRQPSPPGAKRRTLAALGFPEEDFAPENRDR